MTTLTRRRRQLKPVTGVARWHGLIDAELLDDGAAWLEVTTAAGAREYWVERLSEAGRVVGYRLTRKDDAGKAYDVDARFDPRDWRHWQCDCPDATFNARHRPAGERVCKHCKALGAALAKVGLL